MSPSDPTLPPILGRAAQKQRTRRGILDAAVRLMLRAGLPTMEQIAAEAGISRATIYRYFPNADVLLAEAAIDVGVPPPDAVFIGLEQASAQDRVEMVDQLFHSMFVNNEPVLRMMLSEGHRLRANYPDHKGAIRKGSRVPMIEAALDTGDIALRAETRQRLVQALSLIIGQEGMVASMDVLGLNEGQARDLKRWVIGALIKAAADMDAS